VGLSTQLATFRRWMFARHSNPWSAWTRWASTPLVLVPVWTRRPRDAALVAAWLAANPVIFPKPPNDRAWATRAILGEELSVTSPKRDSAKGLTAATSLVALIAIIAGARHRLTLAVVACALQMALTLVYWERMARYWDRYGTSAAPSASSTGS
jgi:uncharacterized protein DUF6653